MGAGLSIKIKQKGDLRKVTKFLAEAQWKKILKILDRYGKMGVDALRAATPVDTGLTSESWYYEIQNGRDSVSLVFHNSNVNKGVPIALILQFGHGTGTGGWVQGRDYINPAIQPILDDLAEKAWLEVTRS